MYTMEYCSAIKRNKSESVLVMWTNLESVIRVSQNNAYIENVEKWY